MEETKTGAKARLTKESFIEFTLVIVITTAIVFVDNAINAWRASLGVSEFSWATTITESVPGLLILLGIAWLGLFLAAVFPKIPAAIWITVIGVLLAMPYSPTGAYVVEATNKINMLATACPILAYAGISMGKDWAEFKRIGWRGILVSLLVMFGTFIGSALIAQIVLSIQGII